MPKVELHKHLEGSVRLSTLMELTEKRSNGELKPTKEMFITDKPVKGISTSGNHITSSISIACFIDLSEFLSKFPAHQEIFDSYEIVERISFEVVEDAANENIKLLELRYSPFFVAMGHEDLEYQVSICLLRLCLFCLCFLNVGNSWCCCCWCRSCSKEVRYWCWFNRNHRQNAIGGGGNGSYGLLHPQ